MNFNGFPGNGQPNSTNHSNHQESALTWAANIFDTSYRTKPSSSSSKKHSSSYKHHQNACSSSQQMSVPSVPSPPTSSALGQYPGAQGIPWTQPPQNTGLPNMEHGGPSWSMGPPPSSLWNPGGGKHPAGHGMEPLSLQVPEDTVLGSGLVNWCHQCKVKKRVVQCCNTNHKSKCVKRYCEGCLRIHYSEYLSSINEANWICPACRHICSCAACKRKALWVARTPGSAPPASPTAVGPLPTSDYAASPPLSTHCSPPHQLTHCGPNTAQPLGQMEELTEYGNDGRGDVKMDPKLSLSGIQKPPDELSQQLLQLQQAFAQQQQQLLQLQQHQLQQLQQNKVKEQREQMPNPAQLFNAPHKRPSASQLMEDPGAADFLEMLMADVEVPVAVSDFHTEPAKEYVSVLHRACEEDNTEMVQALLREDADMLKEDIGGETPLHYAIGSTAQMDLHMTSHLIGRLEYDIRMSGAPGNVQQNNALSTKQELILVTKALYNALERGDAAGAYECLHHMKQKKNLLTGTPPAKASQNESECRRRYLHRKDMQRSNAELMRRQTEYVRNFDLSRVPSRQEVSKEQSAFNWNTV